jgi:hypothetical protein
LRYSLALRFWEMGTNQTAGSQRCGQRSTTE